MFSGKVKAALRLLNDSDITVKPLSLDTEPSGESMREVFRENIQLCNRLVHAEACLACWFSVIRYANHF